MKWFLCVVKASLIIVVSLFFLLLSSSESHAATYNCTTTVSGTWNWNTSGNWATCNNTYPGGVAGHVYNVAINSTTATTINLTTSLNYIGNITIIGNGVNHIVNLNGWTMTTSGTTALNAPTSNTRNNTIAVGTGIFNAGGNVTLTAGSAASRVSQITASTGTINISGTVSYGGTATGAIISVSGAGLVIAQSIGANGTFTENAGTGSLRLTGANPTVQIGANYTYNNLEFAGSGTMVFSGTPKTINGTLTATSGSIDFGANAITINGATTVKNGATITFSSATNTKIFGGLVTLEAGSIWNNTANSPVTFRGGITNDGAATLAFGSGAQTFDTNAQAIGGTTGISIPNMTINTIVVTNNFTSSSNDLTVTTALAGTGTLRQAINGYLTIQGSATITTIDGGTNSPNTVEYTGSGSYTVGGGTYSNLLISGSGNGSIGNNITVNTNVNVSAGTLTFGAFTTNVLGTTDITGTLAITNTTGTKTFGGLVTVNNGGSFNNSGNEAVTFNGGLDNDGTFTSGTGVYTFATNQSLTGNNVITFSAAGGTTAISISGGIIVQNDGTVNVPSGNIVGASGTSEWQNNANSTLEVGGTLLATGILDVSSDNNLVKYDGTSAQTIKVPATAYHDLEYAGSNTGTLGGTTTVDGTITITSGAISLSSYTLNIKGDFTNNASLTGATGTVAFIDAVQTSTITNPAGGTTFTNLTISTASKQVLFDDTGTTNVTGTLTLNGGACNSLVEISSDNPGTQFHINATGTKNVTYTRVTDSYADSAISLTNSMGTNTFGWNFGSTVCNILSLSAPSNTTLNPVSIAVPAPSSTGNTGEITIMDSRGSSVGWSLTATASHFGSVGSPVLVSGSHTITSSGTYDYATGGTYTVTVSRVQGPNVEYDVTGLESATAMPAGSDVPIGTRGVTATFSGSYTVGDQWTISVYTIPTNSNAYFSVDPDNSSFAVVSGSATGITIGSVHGFTSTSDPASILTASNGNGAGEYTIDPDLSLTVPVGSHYGNYKATITLTLL